MWLVPLSFALMLSSMVRAHVAAMLGDPRPALTGLLSPNPVRHLDPVGSILVPVMLAVTGLPVFGWGKAMPIDRERLRNPRLDAVLVALTGPLVFLCLCALSAAAIGTFIPEAALQGPTSGSAATDVGIELLFNLMIVGAMLAVFNLLPIPPLDGAVIVESLLPRRLGEGYARLDRYALLLVILLIFVLPMISPELSVVRRVVAPVATAIVGFFLWCAGVLR